MTKSDLIKNLSEETGIAYKNAKDIVEEFFYSILEALSKGNRVEVRGFGNFTNRAYGAYMGRNPKTGERIRVEPKVLPFFKVGKELRESINQT